MARDELPNMTNKGDGHVLVLPFKCGIENKHGWRGGEGDIPHG
jgi:hypothetical protein